MSHFGGITGVLGEMHDFKHLKVAGPVRSATGEWLCDPIRGSGDAAHAGLAAVPRL
ncbi:MAG: hypothetical protein RIA09_04480 [Hoeflea sp.]|jgi:hypothetical protein|uniref:hypothetical protein n=1 Tax=Hoeflea sp. TaxID=1940281 RepID=UPI0032EBF4DF